MDSVRAAAERVRTWFAEHFDPEFENQHPGFLDDVWELLAANPADSELPVDEAWLVSAGGKKHEWHPQKITFYREDGLPVGLWDVDDGWKAMLILAEHHSVCVVRGLKTRGAVRSLARALGIPLREKP